MEARLHIGDIVQHFKRETLLNPMNQYLYRILGIAEHTETGEYLVIYQALYQNTNPDKNEQFKVYARPFVEFMSAVDKEKYPNINQVYRFELYKGELFVGSLGNQGGETDEE